MEAGSSGRPAANTKGPRNYITGGTPSVPKASVTKRSPDSTGMRPCWSCRIFNPFPKDRGKKTDTSALG